MRVFGIFFLFLFSVALVFFGQNFTAYRPENALNVPKKPDGMPDLNQPEMNRRLPAMIENIEQTLDREGRKLQWKDESVTGGPEGTVGGELEKKSKLRWQIMDSKGQSSLEMNGVKCSYSMPEGRVSMEMGNLMLEQNLNSNTSGVKMNFKW